MNRQIAIQTHQQKPSATPSTSGLLQRKCACGNHTMGGGECTECSKEKQTLQRASLSSRGRENEGEGEVPPIVHEVLRSPGQPLDPAARTFFEPRFGHDFNQVRVHTDAKAAESARVVGALAYTVGRDVVLGSTIPMPLTIEGRRLMAHELAHVLQQRGREKPSPDTISISSPNDGAEVEADSAAEQMINGTVPAVTLNTMRAPLLARLPFGIRLPTGLRFLDPTEETMARAVYGSSVIFRNVLLSDAVGGGGRPFTTYVPALAATVINVGPSAYATPGSNRNLLIHELAHSWQSQHHPNPTQFMVNSIASQAAAGVVGDSAYCYKPGKWFGLYGAEQIAQQVENGEAPIVSHVAAASPGVPDVGNMVSLSVPRWETSGAPGIRC